MSVHPFAQHHGWLSVSGDTNNNTADINLLLGWSQPPLATTTAATTTTTTQPASGANFFMPFLLTLGYLAGPTDYLTLTTHWLAICLFSY